MRSRSLMTLAALASAVFVPLAFADAQCADGSPPPCRTHTVAAATPRRVNPPLDERAWIVVPFDNLAKNEETDWLRSASVNLLYLDMSRWKDIRVVDDERVADLVRETPEAANAATLSLNAGMAVAKRAGAGRLVMGDVLKLGTRTRVTAKVYDVRTGQRIRSVSEETAVQDSVMPLFGKLARKILNVAPPQGANVGGLGTTRVDAYQEYIAGVEALNRFDLAAAKTRLQRALDLDSTFALAHFKMSGLYGWSEPGNPAQRRHAEAASRLMTALPARERALITGQLHSTTGNWADACRVYEGLHATDSLDVEALYGIGECKYHDLTATPVAGDTARVRFRANWQESIRAFQRVLELDPQYHLAYQHIIDALGAERHTNATYCVEDRCRTFTAYLIRRGDSIVAEPVEIAPRADTAGVRRQAEEYTRTRSRQRNLDAAAAVARQWMAAAPNENRALLASAGVALVRGQITLADSLMSRVKSTGAALEELRGIFWRMEIAFKRGRTAEAARLYDSLRTSSNPIPGQPSVRFGNAIAGYGPVFGRLAEFDSLMAVGMRRANAPPLVAPYQHHAIRTAIGVPLSDSGRSLESALFEFTKTNRGVRFATNAITATLTMALRAPRAQWPSIDTTSESPRLRPAIAMARRDTAALRAAANTLDSLLREVAAGIGSDTGFAVVAADAYLALGDTARALRTLRFALDTAALASPYFPLSSQGFTAAAFVARMMLLRADLAAATGAPAEAREAYRRFIGLWERAHPELQPIVERARKRLAEL